MVYAANFENYLFYSVQVLQRVFYLLYRVLSKVASLINSLLDLILFCVEVQMSFFFNVDNSVFNI